MLSDCLALVFEPLLERVSKSGSGHRLFASFVNENRSNFWNTELVESLQSLRIVGFVQPATVFVSSSDENGLDVLRSAWKRRLLLPAKGFKIASVGDVGGLAIRTVEQLQFVPLAELVCRAVADLNRRGRPATMDSLRHWLDEQIECPKTSHELLRQTLSSLIASGLIYRLGEHLFVGVPTTIPYHTSNSNKCSRECQTGASIVNGGKMEPLTSSTTKPNQMPKRRNLLARLFTRAEPDTKRRPLTFTAQFPPPEWMCNPAVINQPLEKKTENQRFYTFADNLCTQTVNNARSNRKPRLRRHYSSSSECLDYGPIDPPERLPPTLVNPAVPSMRRRDHHRPPLEGRTSTPTDGLKGSDSAYSVSPVVTETVLSSAGKFSSWSGSEANEHTYVNVRDDKNNTTRFEEVTQTGDLLVDHLRVS